MSMGRSGFVDVLVDVHGPVRVCDFGQRRLFGQLDLVEFWMSFFRSNDLRPGLSLGFFIVCNIDS